MRPKSWLFDSRWDSSASRSSFALWTFRHLFARRRQLQIIVVQGYSLAALFCNVFGRLFSVPVAMLVCSPVERYFMRVAGRIFGPIGPTSCTRRSDFGCLRG